ncbi:hypothetical protein TNIN_263581 [Trichonephila inaurata madagascariensis]|uniref:Uncharacterized protein n=1 Tax=Trichonephila inaurata madagascariensis TaxID=2747483 RepID=A0A8X6MDG5_9ARAC|nr:hypothetical protein TNIN_263501 [Trichonephila inaurata madagascariensis]GFS43189.1 hypothetical protein TNIN_263581 [Trichonephila inaurata madagascariensis]
MSRILDPVEAVCRLKAPKCSSSVGSEHLKEEQKGGLVVIVLNVPHTSSTPVRSLSGVKSASAAPSVGKRTSEEQKGGKTCTTAGRRHMKLGVRGAKDGHHLRGSPSTFPDVRGQV